MTDKHTLVERLRYHGEDHGNGMLLHAVLFAEAATRITTLEAREAELVEAAKLAFPRGVCVTNRNIPDDTIVPVDFTMGELRRIDAAIARATLAKHQEGEG